MTSKKPPSPYFAVFDRIGEPQTRTEFACRGDEVGASAREWLLLEQQKRDAESAAKRDAREERTLSIASEALSIAKEANRIASEDLAAARASATAAEAQASSARQEALWARWAAIIATVAAIAAASTQINELIAYLRQ